MISANILKLSLIALIVTAICQNNVFAAQQKIYIDLPGHCYAISSIDGDRVNLKSLNSPCNNELNVLPVEIDDSYKNVIVYIDGTFFKKQEISSFKLDDIRASIESGEKYGKNFKIPENRYAEIGRTAAENALKTYQSSEFQDKLTKETNRLKSKLFSKETGSLSQQIQVANGGNSQARVLSQYERIYIFISSSVPVETLRAYVEDINKIGEPNIVMVMRGFIGGVKYAKPTQDFITALAKKNPRCNFKKEKCDFYASNVIVDPLLFRKYNVSQVPAIVYAPNVVLKDSGQSEGKEGNVSVSDFFMLSGDVSLSFALNSIYKESKSDSLKKAHTVLESGFYK